MLRLICAASVLAMLAACTPEPQSPASEPAPATEPTPGADTASEDTPVTPSEPANGYSADWEMIPFWSGEYPHALAVAGEDVTVMAHAFIHRTATADISCDLPHKATYSPWNQSRIESDDLDFVTMTAPTDIQINEDVDIETYAGENTVTLSLKAGDTLTYKTYLAEGYYIAEKDGVEYELGQGDLPESTIFEEGEPEEEWLNLRCANGPLVWLRYSDLVDVPGIEIYNYTGYGEAADLP